VLHDAAYPHDALVLVLLTLTHAPLGLAQQFTHLCTQTLELLLQLATALRLPSPSGTRGRWQPRVQRPLLDARDAAAQLQVLLVGLCVRPVQIHKLAPDLCHGAIGLEGVHARLQSRLPPHRGRNDLALHCGVPVAALKRRGHCAAGASELLAEALEAAQAGVDAIWAPSISALARATEALERGDPLLEHLHGLLAPLDRRLHQRLGGLELTSGLRSETFELHLQAPPLTGALAVEHVAHEGDILPCLAFQLLEFLGHLHLVLFEVVAHQAAAEIGLQRLKPHLQEFLLCNALLLLLAQQAPDVPLHPTDELPHLPRLWVGVEGCLRHPCWACHWCRLGLQIWRSLWPLQKHFPALGEIGGGGSINAPQLLEGSLDAPKVAAELRVLLFQIANSIVEPSYGLLQAIRL